MNYFAILFATKMAEKEQKVNASHLQPLRIKKLYLLAVLLLDTASKPPQPPAAAAASPAAVKGKDKDVGQGRVGEGSRRAKADGAVMSALVGLLHEDATAFDGALVEKTWRCVYAFHLYILAQRQLFAGTEFILRGTRLGY